MFLTWSGVAFLYSLHWSELLLYGNSDLLKIYGFIVFPALVSSLIFRMLRKHTTKSSDGYDRRLAPSVELLQRRLFQCMVLWIVLAIFETIVSGGLPIIWLITGSSKTYFDYGIPSLHGMVNALFMAVAVAYWALYLYTGHRAFLRFPAFAILWTLVLVTRGTTMVFLIECAIVFMRLRPIKTTTLARLLVLALVVLLVFGFIGDLRSGADTFRAIAEPTNSYPDWLPSGMLWGYIYITTPLNNLMLTMHTRKPLYQYLLPATTATLFPTVLRNRIYGEEAAKKIIQGELESQSLTVSTAYIGPFQDMGVYGIMGYSMIAAFLCEIYWHKNGFWNIFVFSVFAQALFLSLFYNLLFSLPILGQLVWFYYLSRVPQNHTRAPFTSPSHNIQSGNTV